MSGQNLALVIETVSEKNHWVDARRRLLKFSTLLEDKCYIPWCSESVSFGVPFATLANISDNNISLKIFVLHTMCDSINLCILFHLKKYF